MKLTTISITSFYLLAGVLATAADVSAPARPKLQIINGSNETVDVFWLKSATERISNGSIAPGRLMPSTTFADRAILCRERMASR